jgi:hypothetical protein
MYLSSANPITTLASASPITTLDPRSAAPRRRRTRHRRRSPRHPCAFGYRLGVTPSDRIGGTADSERSTPTHPVGHPRPIGAVAPPRATRAGRRHQVSELLTVAVHVCQSSAYSIEHTCRLLKQTLGWTSPKLRDPHAADRWTWLVLAVHTQLRLARGAVAYLRRPWERPTPAERLTPAPRPQRVSAPTRQTRSPAAAPKPSRPGPARPPGHRNHHPATRHDVHILTSTKTSKTAKKTKRSNSPRPRRTG